MGQIANLPDWIRKKRDGGTFTPDEIRQLIDAYTKGDVPDYQMAALLMAVYFQGMNDEETTALTEAMVNSGDRLDLSALSGTKVDKHSTGGVGDKTTLVLVPMVAACGLPVAKMSGRGLGHTGGTIDKLESIPGVRTDLSMNEFLEQVEKIGAALGGQTGDLTPADKKLYALRDVTGTVESIPLIAASIMSKKLAAGCDAFVLDVKAGEAAFMKTPGEAEKLARAMIGIARGFGRQAIAWVTRMDEPLGYAVGNALEVYEAVETLQGNGPKDLRELALTLGAEMLVVGEVASDVPGARRRLERAIASGEAYEKFMEIVTVQGGDWSAFTQMQRQGAPAGYVKRYLIAGTQGYVQHIDGFRVGQTAMKMGAGRSHKDEAIDPHVGVRLLKKTTDEVGQGEPMAEVVAADEPAADAAIAQLARCFSVVSDGPLEPSSLLMRRFET